MHCREVKKGVWECVADGPTDAVTGKRRQLRRRGKTRKETASKVEKALRELSEDLIDEKRVRKKTFQMVANEWILVYAASGVKRSSVRIRQKEINILCRYIASVNIAKISHKMYQNILIDLTDEDYARTTISGVNSCAGMIFKYAIRDKLIKMSPADGAIVPKKRRSVEEIEKETIEEKYLEVDELNQFLKATTKHGLDLDKERFFLMAFTGMRPGELCALKWSDCDFAKQTIRITKTLYNEDNNMRKYELTPPKTEGSVRTIAVADEIMEMLRPLKVQQSRLRLLAEPEEYHDENFMFARPNGYPFIPKTLITRMERLLDKTSISETKKATPHIFRHTHISMLTAAKVALPSIMERVGHEDAKTTLKIYTHVTKKTKEDDTKRVAETFGAILNIGAS
ncbi:tyrosine-type recombinase/integrase [Aureibacillus halotolerans]|uniref:Site-specific recombinase XerD n=1 Tax=Aureibacillus halotolerans TaxID=1508390 RepID=A0A4R6TTF5_9BACI|nr:site-specific integrase [Aureibacillus halotolerans]TDQ35233.1 site-specific recombinase XerD [Aureibacillus halotolerans]